MSEANKDGNCEHLIKDSEGFVMGSLIGSISKGGFITPICIDQPTNHACTAILPQHIQPDRLKHHCANGGINCQVRRTAAALKSEFATVSEEE